MRHVLFLAVPFEKDDVTRALESGVDAVVCEPDKADAVRALGRVEVLAPDDFVRVRIESKADEERAAEALAAGRSVLLMAPWEIIPVENLLAGRRGEGALLGAEARSLSEARLAAGVLERGVDFIAASPDAAMELPRIVSELRLSRGREELVPGRIVSIRPVGLGHRVCVDTLSILSRGQGMLTGNSSAFTFLVHAETEANPYVASRPFRVNAGAVHAYAFMADGRTRYLEELRAGDEVLIAGSDGMTTTAVVGRSKVEVRPMLAIEAEVGGRRGGVFLQNAETIRLVRPTGEPVSVVALSEGDEVLVRLDKAGRHFGMAVDEEITEA
ncbi:3-dehydroquinate synthase [Desulfovibrio sp. X2]|uniref:3-dehydroquinate synthase II n=1 Tax=Desulfovibrio sp. X2 TaxID=941449 RepID=UPI0003588920|nr:3-dehydroquinate synthase II [Desulfovibrio sp. X2]EPR36312.1 3-dehydroquinate synthase [Desulfovibrio sp. X2]